jgi:hypothetical protein
LPPGNKRRNKWRTRRAAEAEPDLGEIWCYVASKSASPDIAERLISSEESLGPEYARMAAGSSARATREPDARERGFSFFCSQPVAFRTRVASDKRYAVRTKPQSGRRFARYYLAGQLRCGSSAILFRLRLA